MTEIFAEKKTAFNRYLLSLNTPSQIFDRGLNVPKLLATKNIQHINKVRFIVDFDPVRVTGLFLYPLKTSENQRF